MYDSNFALDRQKSLHRPSGLSRSRMSPTTRLGNHITVITIAEHPDHEPLLRVVPEKHAGARAPSWPEGQGTTIASSHRTKITADTCRGLKRVSTSPVSVASAASACHMHAGTAGVVGSTSAQRVATVHAVSATGRLETPSHVNAHTPVVRRAQSRLARRPSTGHAFPDPSGHSLAPDTRCVVIF